MSRFTFGNYAADMTATTQWYEVSAGVIVIEAPNESINTVRAADDFTLTTVECGTDTVAFAQINGGMYSRRRILVCLVN